MTTLLNADGTASMATIIMSSHHAFRRDLACIAAAAPAELVVAEWTHFRNALHAHHQSEDAGMFPMMRAEHPELAAAIDQLDAQHHDIDELLGSIDNVRRLADVLATHLDLEERTVIPHLRATKHFPAPPSDEALAMYADGFAWSSAGLAPDVQAQIFALLPAALRDRIPAARAAFDERCRRVWGRTHADVSTTSVP